MTDKSTNKEIKIEDNQHLININFIFLRATEILKSKNGTNIK